MTTFKKLSTLLTVLALTLCLVFSFASCNLIGGECEHADNDKDHKCDECGEVLSECADADKNHKCDVCDKALSECADADKNHKCDECGETYSQCSDIDPKDHYCDICDDEISKCADADPKDHKCDECGETYSQCSDIDPKDHVCDWCGGNVGGQCADSETDYDHACDYCGTVLANCADGDDADHACDVCAKSLCADGEDADHNCDVCQMNLCDDADNNHACDVCEANLCYDSADRGHTCDVCDDLLCKDADGDKACDVCGDPVGAETLPVITVYVEGANCTINGKTAVRFYGSEEDKSVVPSYTADQYVIDFWFVFDGTNNVIAVIENGDAFTPTADGKYYITPVFIANDLSGVSGADVKLDVSDSDKVSNDNLTAEWSDTAISDKIVVPEAGKGILGKTGNHQFYLVVDPANAANLVLISANNSNGVGGSNATVEVPISNGDLEGNTYEFIFDYFLDYSYCNSGACNFIYVIDEEGNKVKVANIEQTTKRFANGNSGEATADSFLFLCRTPDDKKPSVYASLSSDTWYTLKVVIDGNNVSTYWSVRGSDEWSFIETQDFSSKELSNKKLVSMYMEAGYWNNSSISYLDNLYFGKQHKCVDADSNHACDECAAKLCADGKDLDHLCDVCGDSLCYEGEIADHYCDGCGAEFSKCADENKNHYCDICGKGGFGGDACVDEDPKTDGHNCNYCGANLCVDVEPKDHVCDVCEAVLSECADADNNHDCDYCGKEDITVCVDENKDHICDICKAEGQGEHADADGDKDHLCDYCGKEASECVDDDKNYVCDECEKALCGDADANHACDITNEHTCVYVKTECADADKNHVCDFEGCKAAVGTHADGDTENHVCDYCGKFDSSWCTNDAGETDDCKCDVCKRLIHNNDVSENGVCSVCGAMTFEGSITSGVNLYTQSSGNQTAFVFGETYAPESMNGIVGNIVADPSNAANYVLKLVINGNKANNTGGSSLGGIPTFTLQKSSDNGGKIHVIEYDFNWATSVKSGWRNPFTFEAFDETGAAINFITQNPAVTKDDKTCVNTINTAAFTEGTVTEGAFRFGYSTTSPYLFNSNTWYRIKYIWNQETGNINVYVSTDGGANWTLANIEEARFQTDTAVAGLRMRFTFYGHAGTFYYDNMSYNVVSEMPEV